MEHPSDRASAFADMMSGLFKEMGWDTKAEPTEEGTKYVITRTPVSPETNNQETPNDQKERSSGS